MNPNDALERIRYHELALKVALEQTCDRSLMWGSGNIRQWCNDDEPLCSSCYEIIKRRRKLKKKIKEIWPKCPALIYITGKGYPKALQTYYYTTGEALEVLARREGVPALIQKGVRVLEKEEEEWAYRTSFGV